MVKKVVRLLVLSVTLGGLVLEAAPALAGDSAPPVRIRRSTTVVPGQH
jgi:hypothetical protein